MVEDWEAYLDIDAHNFILGINGKFNAWTNDRWSACIALTACGQELTSRALDDWTADK